MKLTRNKIFLGILGFGLATILLVLFDAQYFYLRAIFSFVFLTTIPGLLIMLMLKIRKIGFWEYLAYTIGLSIAFLMFAGLSINWILPWLHITDKPLSLIPLLIGFNIILSIFGIIAYVRNNDLSLKIQFPKLDWLNKICFATPVVFSILSILGAITLNNGGPNYLTMIMLGGIAVYVFMVVLLRDKLNENIFPWTVLLTSVSLLLMQSLRSWYVLGWDINQELKYFTITNTQKYWLISASKDPYEACLSITILPTIFSSFTHIGDQFIYKLCMQLIFALTSLSIFIILRKKIDAAIAYLGSFFYISQPWFTQLMPALIRQEVALFFFSLVFLLLSNTMISLKKRNVLFTFFSFSLIVSHYSTAYITAVLFLIYYITFTIYKQLFPKHQTKSALQIRLVLIFVLLTYFWTFQLTATSSNLTNFIGSFLSTVKNISSTELLSTGFDRLIFKNYTFYTSDNIEKYYRATTQLYINRGSYNLLYEPRYYADYTIHLVHSSNVESSSNSIVGVAVSNLAKLDKILLCVLMPVFGTFLILLLSIKKKRVFDIDMLMYISALPIISSIIILPLIKISYNLERIFLQILILLIYPLMFGMNYVFSKVFRKRAILISMAILLFYFMYTTGLNYYITGGPAYTYLYNYGSGYDLYYTFDSEIHSAKWLVSVYDKKSNVYADMIANLRLTGYTNMKNITFDILPSTIDKQGYVYLSKSNYTKEEAFVSYPPDLLIYNYPLDFMNKNKGLIYNNGNSVVYK